MPLYRVFARPAAATDAGAVFIAEKFSWSAMILPPLWALAHGLWLELVLILAGMLLLFAAAIVIGGMAALLVYGLAAIFLGFAAPGLRARALLRRGYDRKGDAIALGPEFAEAEYIRVKGVS